MRNPKVIKTIKYKIIPIDIRERAIMEAKFIAKHKIANFNDSESVSESTSRFAFWTETPSGHLFWSMIKNAKSA